VNLAALRARLEALAGRVPTPPDAWPTVQFPIVETGPTGPVVTGTVVLDKPTGRWREVPPNTATQTAKGTSNADSL
jgi:hypothetical protein